MPDLLTVHLTIVPVFSMPACLTFVGGLLPLALRHRSPNLPYPLTNVFGKRSNRITGNQYSRCSENQATTHPFSDAWRKNCSGNCGCYCNFGFQKIIKTHTFSSSFLPTHVTIR